MSVKWLARAVPQTSGLYPYVPGKPVETLLREKGLTRAIKLASNENPYGPSPKAVAAIGAAAAGVHRYPDGDANALKEKLAKIHNVDRDRLLLGNGSNEVLELLIRTFAGNGDEVVFSSRAFIVYALAAQAAGATPVAVPEADGLSHDLEAMAAAVNSKTKVVCIANPNNPTGTLHDNSAIQTFLDRLPRDVLVIIDEAYYEFVADRLGDSVQDLAHPGLVISRTFSKAYGLAGCRIGYAVADAVIVGLVNRFREPFNLNLLGQVAAVAALDDRDWVMARVADNNSERARLESALEAEGLLGGRCFGNFVLLKHSNCPEILRRLEDRGIIPRPLAPYGMADYLRISVGSAAENGEFLHALNEIIAALQE
ncbi:histidinol-phosphate aminotransferase [Mariprofundus ferrinatatus]|uniref:Histidinol-phosphate aminotransferase n=1 Tax=Mariprofundus ferrinatatus TaxID=1921087 RepID=A0A2K8L2W4_9PROT|nr:histidinol-phosphate transaminase [Mariprofundus ferrinatatus]ATX81442.1 histidinol-phosphate aminotransferase [Mariprofundus ferrinatatus]